jgi:hypothetical protein
MPALFLPSPLCETGGRGFGPAREMKSPYGTWSPWQVVGNAEFKAPGTAAPLAVFPRALKLPATTRNSHLRLFWPPG